MASSATGENDNSFDSKLEAIITKTFLNLEEIEHLIYRSTHLFQPILGRSVFGGQVVGQALVAASKTVPQERQAHSLHCYFLRPGSTECPIVYHVQEIRDGGSYSSRFVNATQKGKSIFTMMVSFTKEEDNTLSHQFSMPVVPPPEDCMEVNELLQQRLEMDIGEQEREYIGHRLSQEMTFLRKPVDPNSYYSNASFPARQCIWMKTKGHVGEDQQMQKCAAAYMSDSMLIGTALLPFEYKPGSNQHFMTSIDHAIWYHHPIQVDDWLLYEMESPTCGHGRAHAQGRMWTRDGTLVLSVAQEGVLRAIRPPNTASQL